MPCRECGAPVHAFYREDGWRNWPCGHRAFRRFDKDDDRPAGNAGVYEGPCEEVGDGA